MHGPGLDDDDGAIAQINIIPLVDVILVVLIIFMVTTVFQKDSAVKLDLPKGARSEQASTPPTEITVSLDKNGGVYVNGKPTKVEDLEREVKSRMSIDPTTGQITRKTILVLRGDEHVIYGKLMPVLDEVSRTGVSIMLALKPGTK